MPLIADSTRESSLTSSTYSARTRSNTSPNRFSCLYVSVEFDVAAPTSCRSESNTSVATTAAQIPDGFIHSPFDTERDRRAAAIGSRSYGMIPADVIDDQARPVSPAEPQYAS